MNPTLTFSQLHPGDRFTLPADHRLFTKLTEDTAREHSVHSINLKEEGFGYAEDPIETLPGEAPVEYFLLSSTTLRQEEFSSDI